MEKVSKLNILLISQYFWPENFRVNDLAIQLAENGNKVIILTGYPNYPDGVFYKDFILNKKKYSKLRGIKIIRVPILPRGKSKINLILNYISFVFTSSTIGLFRIRNIKFDVIFINQLSPITVAIPAIIYSTLKKTPIAMWVLDLWPNVLEDLNIFSSSKIIFLFELLVSFIYKKCDLIFTQSKSFIPEIKKRSFSKKVIYLPGWAEETFQKKSKSIASEIPKVNKFKIVFAGNIGECQDFDCILEAAEILKSLNKKINFFIIGEGRRYEWLKNQVKVRNLESNFHVLGRFPLHRMPSFFNSSDALLVSLANKKTFSMTIPAKIQDYLSSGKPIIASLSGEGAKLIKENNLGVVAKAGFPIELAKRINYLASLTKEELDEISKNCKKTSLREFNRKNLIKKVIYELNLLTKTS